MKKVLLINTGGTISSVETSSGLTPKPGLIADAIKSIADLKREDMPEIELTELSPLIDSANIAVYHWNKIASLIQKNYSSYDGFVILHGTDTLAYTASSLSFILENLNKPVILTGSQIPLSAFRSDAKDNLVTSIWLAQSDMFNEVAIYFNQKLLRGNRSQKVSAYRFSAFDSPNLMPLANVGTFIEWHHGILLEKPNARFQAHEIKEHYISNFRLFPGFSHQVLKEILALPLEGLILETYGNGNASSNDHEIIKALSQAIERGVVIINCSQCFQGRVNMSTYATGNILKRAGLISGADMTAEAAHGKLLYLLSRYSDKEKVKSLIGQSLCGELS